MRTYSVPYHLSPDPTQLPALAVDQHLWLGEHPISMQVRLWWNEGGLFLRLESREAQILARYTGQLDPVCCDSCMEFFFCPEADNDRYFNFEVNPNGAMYVGYGFPDKRRVRLQRDTFPELFALKTFRFDGGWGVELKIPPEFVQTFLPSFTWQAGQQLRANFYKCGDETETPHYIAWNPVLTPHPSYHQPGYFGLLTLNAPQ